MNLKHAINQLDELEPRWFAVYTRYKQEKVVLKRLKDKGIDSYVPLTRRFRKYDKRLRHFDIPLISCYVFTKITRKEYVSVLETEGVVKFIKFSDNLISIPEEEIQWLQKILLEDLSIELDQEGMIAGQRVEVVRGNLIGLKGTLMNTSNKKNFLVEFSGIGQSFRMYVDPACLKLSASRVSAL
ncbi:MAG: UpxY family transcription antiterminator [Saprospiraceae bacterium]|nr:UpxY family transcription antiterminator [Saprospiraceae bacterium]MCB0666960.1 UpxY family transcription antiterminator [Saprospiraceae bacterium]MCB9319498.1 UpxY family transcription antiterminator [Lewinellaceae bacterium]